VILDRYALSGLPELPSDEIGREQRPRSAMSGRRFATRTKRSVPVEEYDGKPVPVSR